MGTDVSRVLSCRNEIKTITYGVVSRDAGRLVFWVYKQGKTESRKKLILHLFISFQFDLNIEFDPMITRSLVSSYLHGNDCVKSAISDPPQRKSAIPRKKRFGLRKSSVNGKASALLPMDGNSVCRVDLK